MAALINQTDIAGMYQADENYEPGTVLEFGGDFEVTIGTKESRRVAAEWPQPDTVAATDGRRYEHAAHGQRLDGQQEHGRFQRVGHVLSRGWTGQRY